jgi:CBS domain containing-hemolysin-like protein
VSDVREVLPGHFGVLALPVLEFLNLKRARGRAATELSFVRASTTFQQLLAKMAATRRHHVFVLGEQGGEEEGAEIGGADPIGVISLTDILRLAL